MIEGKRNNKYCYYFVNDTPVALATIFRLANQNDYKYMTKLFKATNLRLSEYQEKNEKKCLENWFNKFLHEIKSS